MAAKPADQPRVRAPRRGARKLPAGGRGGERQARRARVLAARARAARARAVRASYREIAKQLGVSGNQVYMWYKRRATTGFPDSIGVLRKPKPGQNYGQPLFDLESVEEWYSGYNPNARRGEHWAAKREASDGRRAC